jgi:transketolase
VLPPHLPVIAVEAGATRGWYRYAGRNGAVIGLDRFGESAPEKELFKYFGFTPERVADAVRAALGRRIPQLSNVTE